MHEVEHDPSSLSATAVPFQTDYYVQQKARTEVFVNTEGIVGDYR